MSATDPKAAVIAACREVARLGLSHGTSGNVSIRRDADSFYISPTGMAYEALVPAHIPRVELSGTWHGERRPSSEWRFHRDIYKARTDVGAIVHTHSCHATALASLGRGIPAFHYMVAVAGGADIRCAPYATFGTQELSDHAVAALKDRKACLLSNHGVIAVGTTIDAALALAGEVENLARQYVAALQVGAPTILDAAEMQRVLTKFATYGKQDAADPGLAHGAGPA
jgi:L-fuculose-phosphate aldolase